MMTTVISQIQNYYYQKSSLIFQMPPMYSHESPGVPLNTYSTVLKSPLYRSITRLGYWRAARSTGFPLYPQGSPQ